MTPLWWLSQNGLVAAPLAALVAVICRFMRGNPALRNILWLLVLLKLVTPPLPLWPWPAPGLATYVLRDAAPLSESREGATATPTIARTAPSPEAESRPWDGPTLNPVPEPSDSSAPGLQPEARESPAAPSQQGATPTAREADGPAPTKEDFSGTGDHSVSLLTRLLAWLSFIWLAGMAAFALLQILRFLGLSRIVARGRTAPDWLSQEVRCCAATLSIQPPRIRVVPQLSSPILCWWGRPVILWPSVLCEKANPGHWRGVILHELAHLRRRDHWVGWLEIAGECLWWWNPVFWFVRDRLLESADQACDSWVDQSAPINAERTRRI